MASNFKISKFSIAKTRVSFFFFDYFFLDFTNRQSVRLMLANYVGGYIEDALLVQGKDNA